MNSTIVVKAKQVVIPGEVLAEGMDFLPGKGAFRENDVVLSSRVGLVSIQGRVIHIIPLSGAYKPRENDVVIGYIRDMSYSSWFVNIGCPYDGSISLKEGSSEFIERGANLSDYYAIGDIVLTKIINVTREGNIDLSMKGPGLRKLRDGKVIDIPSSKIPRVVGKQGSMISLIKEKTGCNVFAGQNGRVWIQGPNPAVELVATKAVELIGEKSHISGLTEYVSSFLEKEMKEIKK